MRYNSIASTDCRVSEIGLGTVKFGRNADVKYPAEFQLPDDHTINELLAISRDFGVNLLDTAPAYGTSENRLGKLLKGQRHDWVISTKTGEFYSDQKSSFDFSGAATRRSIERSLLNLATDYLDIVLIHSDGKDIDILQNAETMPTLKTLQQEGKIRCIGMSTKTVAGGLAALEISDLVMVTYNRNQAGERPVLDKARQLGKGILVKKALDSGQLAGTDNSENWLQDSLDFVLAHPAVSSVILGTINPEHWLTNLKTHQKLNP